MAVAGLGPGAVSTRFKFERLMMLTSRMLAWVPVFLLLLGLVPEQTQAQRPRCSCEMNDEYGTVPLTGTYPEGQGGVLQDLRRFASLHEAFDDDYGYVRLVALLSPTCPDCIRGFRTIQRILADIDDDGLRVYVVWEPILPSDNRRAAERIAREVSDDRVIQFWDDRRLTGRLWERTLDIDQTAWDVFMVYGPEAEWTGRPTVPDFWMHQLGVRKAPRLNRRGLESEIRAMLR